MLLRSAREGGGRRAKAVNMMSVLGIVGVGVGGWVVGEVGGVVISTVWGVGICGSRGVAIAMLVDTTRLVFGVILAAVALTAYRYRNDYLGGAESPPVLFYFRLWAFTASMLLLIFACDLFLVFLAWDGLGVRSFLLVCHYDKPGRRGGSLVTIVTNRAGDAFFCLGVGVIALSGGRLGGGASSG